MPILYAYLGLSTGPVRCLWSLLLALVAFSSVGRAAEPLMCERGEALLREDFDPASISERWFFRGAFALRDGPSSRNPRNFSGTWKPASPKRLLPSTTWLPSAMPSKEPQ
jgi:hypothetical protein